METHTGDNVAVSDAEMREMLRRAIAAAEELTQALLRIAPAERPRLGVLRNARDESPSTRASVRFWRAWYAGKLKDLPYATCTAAQAYSAYRAFAQRAGELPAQHGVFTRDVVVWSDAAGAPVRSKVMRIGVFPSSRSERMLLVDDPPETSQGQWATACKQQFDVALSRHLAASGATAGNSRHRRA